MTRFKDFDAARAEHQREPLEFKLGGEHFVARGEVPAGVLLDAVAAGDEDAQRAAAFTAMFEAIVHEEDADRFALAVRRVDLGTVYELVGWIMEEVTGRPLSSAGPSEPSPLADLPPSRVVSLSAVETRSA